MNPTKLNFRFDSRLENVAFVAKVTRRLCEDVSGSRNCSAAVELALVEAINNAIEHAYQGQSGHEVTVEVRLSESCVDVSVSENGKSMPALPEGRLPPTDQVNGRGWFLIRQCTDKAWYESIAGKNTVFLHRKFNY